MAEQENKTVAGEAGTYGEAVSKMVHEGLLTTGDLPTKATCQVLKRAKDDEIIFVLRGTDPLAPRIIRGWANQAAIHGVPDHKVQGALRIAKAIEDRQEADPASKKWPA
jgi:hypothetical protein